MTDPTAAQVDATFAAITGHTPAPPTVTDWTTFDPAMIANPQPGWLVQGRMVDPSFTDAAGDLHPGDLDDWHPIQLGGNTCDHTDTICGDCVDSWLCDWNLRMVRP